ncbi:MULTISPECIES: hypothetical protein [Corynebacterium]|jgi:hypothetical protein|uniref:hypothetical protein n=1 Tax=Corynebacterium TaxID=1716 RepID=UPI001EF3FFDC|nr:MULTISPECIES: hypothetical protein [Corynebacterium]MCG7232775.1 hypothetical protein [Corynebacterium sp. ACRPR]MCG7270650.1 hypothetical protein [Corynebacterium sp. ACRQM]MDK8660283.1 hypothetical protein [Corynebacterium sp. MSK204]WKS60752.1 hypothetical protein NLL43_02235 [Corynebacterium accolens]
MTTPADVKDVFASLAGHRVTAQDMADILETSRNTVNLRLKNGLVAEDIIAISRGLNINPVEALVELGNLTRDEVFDFLDGGAKLLSLASIEELVYRLAEDTLSNADKIELGGAARALLERDDLAARRAGAPVSDADGSMPDDDDGIVREFDYSPDEYAADSSINEQEEREKRGEDLID